MAKKKIEPEDEYKEEPVTEIEQERIAREKANIDDNIRCLETQVVRDLGKPPNFTHIEARHLFSNRYRINVWVMHNGGPAISDSFFVRFVTDGIVSEPPVKNKYPKPEKVPSCEKST